MRLRAAAQPRLLTSPSGCAAACPALPSSRSLALCRAQVRHVPTSRSYALKCLRKGQLLKHNQLQHVLSEKDVMLACKHPFLIRLEAVFHSKDQARAPPLDTSLSALRSLSALPARAPTHAACMSPCPCTPSLRRRPGARAAGLHGARGAAGRRALLVAAHGGPL